MELHQGEDLYDLSQFIKSFIHDLIDGIAPIGSSLATDLLNYAVNDVDCMELARSWVQDWESNSGEKWDSAHIELDDEE